MLIAVIVVSAAIGIPLGLISSGGPEAVHTRPTTATSSPPTSLPHSTIPSGAIPIPVGADPQALVAAHPAGTAFVIEAGLHAGFEVRPLSGDTFYAVPGATLDGGDSTPYAFYAFSSSASVPPRAVTIQGYSEAQRLVIRDYTGQHSEQVGAIQPILTPSLRADAWTLRWLEVTGSYSRGITTSDDMVVTGCLIDHNGRLGIGGTGNNVLIDHNEISFNDTRQVTPGVENGGGKFSVTNNLVVQFNDVHDNTGPGFWTDIDARSSTFRGNTLARNSGAGILIEISHGAVITGNEISSSGADAPRGLAGGGIVIATSDGIQVSGNTLTGNHNGITGLQQKRKQGDDGLRVLDNLDIHGNTVRDSGTTGVSEGTGDPSVFARNIKFSANVYQGETFAWQGRDDLAWSAWQGFGQDVNGSWTP